MANGDSQYHHLPLLPAEATGERRKPPGNPSPPRPPSRGERQTFAGQLYSPIESVAKRMAAAPPLASGVQPHLVVRVPLSRDAPVPSIVERLREAGLPVVSVEADSALVAFRKDNDLSEFRAALDAYRQPKIVNDKEAKSTKWDLFEWIDPEGVRGLTPHDRIGERLAAVAGADGRQLETSSTYVVDVELWPTDRRDDTRALVEEATRVVGNEGRKLDDYVGDSLCLVKFELSGTAITRLLKFAPVAAVDLPPRVGLSLELVRRTTRRDFPPPPPPSSEGPRLCVVDSGVARAHPLLSANIGHLYAAAPETDVADQNGHGTFVAGIAAFGDVRTCYESGQFQSPVIVHSARVLDAEGRFSSRRLVINQLSDVFRHFIAPPHDCRVFNLSFGDPDVVYDGGRQTEWAHELDLLARELKILLVVSAGNSVTGPVSDRREVERLLTNYPSFIVEPQARLLDPGTAALAITVGAIAERDHVDAPRGSLGKDIARPLAAAGEMSPITRTGLGVNRAIKPDLVEDGGNLVFGGSGSARVIEHRASSAVMSFQSDWVRNGLFTYQAGTSCAAPVVSRSAAIAWHALEEQLGARVHPNLVRALLAVSATPPVAAVRQMELVAGQQGAIRSVGFGRVDLDMALSSAPSRVTLVAQGNLAIDQFAIYQIPIPDAFSAPGERTLTVALAFDPPVRRRRETYLGVHMDFDLVRGLTLEQVTRRARKPPKKKRGELRSSQDDPIPQRNKLKLEPQVEPRGEDTYRMWHGTLARRSITFKKRFAGSSDTWWLVVRTHGNWAPPETVQDFGVAVALRARSDQLYSRVRQANLRLRERARERAQG